MNKSIRTDKRYKQLLLFNKLLNYKKKIDKNGSVDTWNYQRYAYSEVKNLEVAGDSMNNEILRSKRDKIDLFNEIATG